MVPMRIDRWLDLKRTRALCLSFALVVSLQQAAVGQEEGTTSQGQVVSDYGQGEWQPGDFGAGAGSGDSFQHPFCQFPSFNPIVTSTSWSELNSLHGWSGLSGITGSSMTQGWSQSAMTQGWSQSALSGWGPTSTTSNATTWNTVTGLTVPSFTSFVETTGRFPNALETTRFRDVTSQLRQSAALDQLTSRGFSIHSASRNLFNLTATGQTNWSSLTGSAMSHPSFEEAAHRRAADPSTHAPSMAEDFR